jgi:hypothetical protein
MIPAWAFSTRPAVPVYCRCTPTVRTPLFKSPVSSTISTASSSDDHTPELDK